MNNKVIAYIDQQSYHGLERYDANLLTSIKKIKPDLDITFYCSTRFKSKVASGIEVLPVFNYTEHKSKAIKVFSYLTSIVKIIIDIYNKKIKIVHIQWAKLPIIDLLFIFFIKFFLSIKIVYTEHNPVEHEKASIAHKYINKYINILSNNLVVHTKSSYENMKNMSGIDFRKVIIQPHGLMKLGVLTKNYNPRSEILEFLNRNIINFLFLGIGNHYKGLDILLEAWSSASKFNTSGCGLIVAGKINKEFKASIKDDYFRTPNQLIIDEILSDEEIEYIINASDIVILPHRFISQSGVLMVALAYEKLVICSPKAEFINAIEKASCGWIFNGTSSSMADILINIYSNPKVIMNKKKEYNKKILDDMYSWNDAALVLVQLYMSLEEA
jgi:glycosyltransferase involved in cell wall biosynthesis